MSNEHAPSPAIFTVLVIATLDCSGGRSGSVDAGAADDAATPALTVESVTDLGALSVPSQTVLGRDGTFSGQARDGRVLFAFGDTFLTKKNSIDGTSVLSATSGWSTPGAPLALDEPVDGAGIPAQLIPYTAEEIAANRLYAMSSSQADGWALWPGPVLDPGDGSDLIVLFQRIERMKNGGFPSQGLGTARVALNAAIAVRAPSDLFAPPEPLFGSAGASLIEGKAYLYACERFDCRVARAPASSITDRASYEFWDGVTWTADIARATPFFRPAIALSVTYNPYLGKYLSVTGSGGSSFQLRTADQVEGPWPSSGLTVAPSAGGVLAPPAGAGDSYIYVEHVALRSSDAREIVISYARPLGNFRGEVRLARVQLGTRAIRE